MAIWSPLSVLKRSTTSTYFFADWWCGGCAGCSFPPLQKLVKSFLCSVLWGICQEKARWYMRNHKLLPTYQPSIWMSWSQKLMNVNLQLIKSFCIKKTFFPKVEEFKGKRNLKWRNPKSPNPWGVKLLSWDLKPSFRWPEMGDPEKTDDIFVFVFLA